MLDKAALRQDFLSSETSQLKHLSEKINTLLLLL